MCTRLQEEACLHLSQLTGAMLVVDAVSMTVGKLKQLIDRLFRLSPDDQVMLTATIMSCSSYQEGWASICSGCMTLGCPADAQAIWRAQRLGAESASQKNPPRAMHLTLLVGGANVKCI